MAFGRFAEDTMMRHCVAQDSLGVGLGQRTPLSDVREGRSAANGEGCGNIKALDSLQTGHGIVLIAASQ